MFYKHFLVILYYKYNFLHLRKNHCLLPNQHLEIYLNIRQDKLLGNLLLVQHTIFSSQNRQLIIYITSYSLDSVLLMPHNLYTLLHLCILLLYLAINFYQSVSYRLNISLYSVLAVHLWKYNYNNIYPNHNYL